MATTTPPPSSPPPQPQPPTESQLDNDPPMATPLSLLVPAQPLIALPSSSTSRRLPPPCWTPEETSALIDAYRDKWFSLRKGNLRAAHWQDVAEDVHHRCPDAPLPKTAVQCRHKMEKLRKRYRAELNRAKSIPHHRFSSSWVYFPKMQSMEIGKTAAAATPAVPISSSSTPLASAAAAAANENFNDVEDEDDEDIAYRNYEQRRDFNRDYLQNGLRIKVAGNPTSGSGFRSNPNPNPNPSYGYKSKFTSINSFNSPVSGVCGMNTNTNAMMMNQHQKAGLGKREREGEAATEMVEAIRGLGEGFVRMEKMKIEIMRETERLRMEMEMKRTQMILDSHHRIVEAFAKTWIDINKDASC